MFASRGRRLWIHAMIGREPRYHGRMATNEPPSPSSPAAAASPSAPPAPPVPRTFSPDEGFAKRLDELDPLRGLRDEFFIPTIKALHAADHAQSAHAAGGHAASPTASRPDGHGPCVYLTGNSLGCQPKGVRAAVDDELADWARLGVEGHVHGKHPWLHYHEMFREPLARIVGAKPGEVVAMNTLTVNLHLMMISFYRPTPKRYKILIEDSAFPSDSYAVISQAAFHRFNPSMTVLRMVPRDSEHTLRTEDALAIIEADDFRLHGAVEALGALGRDGEPRGVGVIGGDEDVGVDDDAGLAHRGGLTLALRAAAARRAVTSSISLPKKWSGQFSILPKESILRASI